LLLVSGRVPKIHKFSVVLAVCFREGIKKFIHMEHTKGISITYLVGCFNPFEKYESKCESSPNGGETKKYLKPPPSYPIETAIYNWMGFFTKRNFLLCENIHETHP